MPLPRLRTAVRWTILVLLLMTAAGASWLLIYGGRYLQHEDPLVKADAIFVLAGTRLERPLEAVDLYKAGYAPLIVLSPGRPEPGEYLLKQRGLKFPLEVELGDNGPVRLRRDANSTSSNWRKRLGVEPSPPAQRGKQPILKTGRATGPRSLPLYRFARRFNLPQ